MTNIAEEHVQVSPVTVELSSIFILFPLSVYVAVPHLIVRVPVLLLFHWEVMVRFALLALLSNVPVNAPVFSVAIVAPDIDESTVTVPPPELASNVATSPACFGTPPVAAHVLGVPPLDEAHDIKSMVLHVPVPPTQKHVAALATLEINNKANINKIFFMVHIPI